MCRDHLTNSPRDAARRDQNQVLSRTQKRTVCYSCAVYLRLALVGFPHGEEVPKADVAAAREGRAPGLIDAAADALDASAARAHAGCLAEVVPLRWHVAAGDAQEGWHDACAEDHSDSAACSAK